MQHGIVAQHPLCSAQTTQYQNIENALGLRNLRIATVRMRFTVFLSVLQIKTGFYRCWSVMRYSDLVFTLLQLPAPHQLCSLHCILACTYSQEVVP